MLDWRVKLRQGVAARRRETWRWRWAGAVEPLGGLEPFTESAGVFVDAEVLEDEGERAGGRGGPSGVGGGRNC